MLPVVDADKKVIFSYYRERVLDTSGNLRWSGRVHEAIMPKGILKTSENFRWSGRVHEAITPTGNIFYSDIKIQHRKCTQGDPDRNLRIYQKMLAEEEPAGTTTPVVLWAGIVLSSKVSGNRRCTRSFSGRAGRMDRESHRCLYDSRTVL